MTSRSSSCSSSRTKTNSHTSNVLKAAADLNGSMYSDVCGAKINNVNLVVLHRQQYRRPHVVPNLIENPTSTAEMFYNPHQSTVARKFFKKQKRNLVKRNNLAIAVPQEINSDTASVLSSPKRNIDRSIFGTNSKVNNTNIHVEHVRKSKHRNLNILSDSCEEYENFNILPVEKFVMNAERLRKRDVLKNRMKKKQNVPAKEAVKESNMRSVSQQCTLEYSSETISDSILDKTSPEKEKYLASPERRENNAVLLHDIVDNEATGSGYLKSEPAIYTDNGKLDEAWSADLCLLESANGGRSLPRIYVNPSHDLLFTKSVQSRTSSVSASELDELYQQIRSGPKSKHSQLRKSVGKGRGRRRSPCRSDSEINFYVEGVECKRRAAYSDDNESDKIETTV